MIVTTAAFQPIIITLETAEEAYGLMRAIDFAESHISSATPMERPVLESIPNIEQTIYTLACELSAILNKEK